MAKNITKYLRQIADNLPDVEARFNDFTEYDLLVGVPNEDAGREETNEINNATLAYIHDNGSPAQNIPERPFMIPGIEAARPRVINVLKNGAKAALKGEKDAAYTALQASGLIAQAAIRKVINDGVPPPLSEETLKGRIRNGTSIKGAKLELKNRAEGQAPSLSSAKPLIATAQLRNSINYVLRKRDGSN